MEVTSAAILEAIRDRKPRGWKHFEEYHAIRLAELCSHRTLAVGSPDATDNDQTLQAWTREIQAARPVGGLLIAVLSLLARWALNAAITWAVRWAWDQLQTTPEQANLTPEPHAKEPLL